MCYCIRKRMRYVRVWGVREREVHTALGSRGTGDDGDHREGIRGREKHVTGGKRFCSFSLSPTRYKMHFSLSLLLLFTLSLLSCCAFFFFQDLILLNRYDIYEIWNNNNNNIFINVIKKGSSALSYLLT